MISDKFSKSYGYYAEASFGSAPYPGLTIIAMTYGKKPGEQNYLQVRGITLQQAQSAY